jgi:Double zinc ribbon
MPVALFGITNQGLSLFVNLLLAFLVVVWIALIAWTFLDARRRIRDPFLVGCATAASLFPYVGTVVYAILRPPEFIEDAHERELEIRAAELRLRQLEEQSCPSCGYPIERSFLRCPSCRTRVKDPCEACEKPIDPRWPVCPYCETPQRRAAPRARRAPEEPREAAEAPPKRTARAKRASATREGRHQKGGSRQPRSSASRQAAAASRKAGDAKQRKPEPAESDSAPAPTTRETPGEERPRPAPTS